MDWCCLEQAKGRGKGTKRSGRKKAFLLFSLLFYLSFALKEETKLLL